MNGEELGVSTLGSIRFELLWRPFGILHAHKICIMRRKYWTHLTSVWKKIFLPTPNRGLEWDLRNGNLFLMWIRKLMKLEQEKGGILSLCSLQTLSLKGKFLGSQAGCKEFTCKHFFPLPLYMAAFITTLKSCGSETSNLQLHVLWASDSQNRSASGSRPFPYCIGTISTLWSR